MLLDFKLEGFESKVLMISKEKPGLFIDKSSLYYGMKSPMQSNEK